MTTGLTHKRADTCISLFQCCFTFLGTPSAVSEF